MKEKQLYSVTLLLAADTGLDVEAGSPEEAADIAAQEHCASLCHHCARHLNLGDVCGEIVYLGDEEVLDTTRSAPTAKLVRDLAATLKHFVDMHGYASYLSDEEKQADPDVIAATVLIQQAGAA